MKIICNAILCFLAIKDKYSNWKEFLKHRLTGARTLPKNFYSRVQESLKSRFRYELTVLVIDDNILFLNKILIYYIFHLDAI